MKAVPHLSLVYRLSLAKRDFQSQVTFIMLTSSFKTNIQLLAISPVMMLSLLNMMEPCMIFDLHKFSKAGRRHFSLPKTNAEFGWILELKLNFSSCLMFIIYKVLFHISKKKMNRRHEQITDEEIQIVNKHEKTLNLNRHQVKCNYNNDGFFISLTKNLKIDNAVLVSVLKTG